jgi:hypothetical protein
MGTQWVLQAEFTTIRYCVLEAPEGWPEEKVREWAHEQLMESSLDSDAAWSIHEDCCGKGVLDVWPRRDRAWSRDPSPLLGRAYDIEQERLKPDMFRLNE